MSNKRIDPDRCFGLVRAYTGLKAKSTGLTVLKEQAWADCITSEEFKNLKSQREQIVYLFDHLCVDGIAKFSHTEIADQFGISRQAAEQAYKKGTGETLEPHRPAILKQNEIESVCVFIDEMFSCAKFFLIDEIWQFVADKYSRYLRPDTLRKMLFSKFAHKGKIVDGIPLETCRFDVEIEAIDAYYIKLGDILGIIDYRYCFNVDETGEEEFSDAREIKVFVPADFPNEKAVFPVKRGAKRFTIVHCISSAGRYFPPYYIIPRKTIPNDIWQFLNKENTTMRSQAKGFMTETLFKDYFNNLFLPNLFTHRINDCYWGPALLIMDNLLAHKKAVGAKPEDDLIYLEYYNLYILFLVPHSSDQTQPLDLGIFGSQKAISQRTKVQDNLQEFTKRIIKATQSLEKASNTVAIVNAFRAAGIDRKIDKETGKITLFVNRSKCTKVRNDYAVRQPVEWDFQNEKIPEL